MLAEEVIDRSPFELASKTPGRVPAVLARDSDGIWLVLRVEGPPIEFGGRGWDAVVIEPAQPFTIAGLEFLLAAPV